MEATRLIESDPALAGIPIIALTTHTIQSAGCGCDHYETKPVVISPVE